MIVHKETKVTRADPERRIIWARVCDYGCDREGEILRKGCFDDRTIERFMSGSPILELSHDFQALPMGKVLGFIVSDSDVLVKAKIGSQTEAQDELWEFMKFSGSYGFSVAFIPKRWQKIKVKDLSLREKMSCERRGKKSFDVIKVYEEIELLSIGAVSVPQCPTCLLVSYQDGKVKNECLSGACSLAMSKEGKAPQKPKVDREAVKAVIKSYLHDVITEIVKESPQYDAVVEIVGKEAAGEVFKIKKRMEYREKVIDYVIEQTIPRHYRGRYRARLKSQIKERIKKFI